MIRLLLLCAVALLVAWTVFQLVQSCGSTLDDLGDVSPLPELGARAESAGGYGKLDPEFAASAAGHTLIVHAASGARTIRRHAHTGAIRAVALSMHGKYLATGGAGGELRLWSPAPGEEGPILRHELEGTVETVDAVAFSQDERYLVVLGDSDGIIDLWDVERQEQLESIAVADLKPSQTDAYLLRIHLSESGEVLGLTLAATVLEHLPHPGGQDDGSTILVDAVSGEAIRYREGLERDRLNPAKSSSWNPRGNYWAYTDGSQLHIWKLCPAPQCKVVEIDGRVFLE